MHAHHPGPTNSMQELATQAERLAGKERGNRLGLIFSAITAISLGVMTTKTVLDMIHDTRRLDRERSDRRR